MTAGQTKEGANYIPPNTKAVDNLTPDQVYREIMALKELILQRIGSLEKATDIAHDDMVRWPTEVAKEISHLKEFLDQKIDFLNRQLEIIEQARVEQKRDTRTAVDDALKAAKEAVAESNKSSATAITKSETAFSEQFKQLAIQNSNSVKTFEDRLNDLKDRIGKMEGVGEGKRTNSAFVIGIVLFIVTIIGFLITIYNLKT